MSVAIQLSSSTRVARILSRMVEELLIPSCLGFKRKLIQLPKLWKLLMMLLSLGSSKTLRLLMPRTLTRKQLKKLFSFLFFISVVAEDFSAKVDIDKATVKDHKGEMLSEENIHAFVKKCYYSDIWFG